MPDMFGPIVSGGDVEDAVLDTLRIWIKTYMHHMEDRQGIDRDTYPGIKSYSTHSTFETIPGDDFLPLIVVVSPGLNSPPVKEGDGKFRATWSVGVVIVVSSNSQEAVRKLVMTYAAAIRTCLIQKRDLGGISRGVVWDDEGYDDIPTEDSRSIMAARLYFSIEADGVAQAFTGPLHPEDSGDWPTVGPEGGQVEINKEAV